MSREIVMRVSDDLDKAVTSDTEEITAVTLGYNGEVVELDVGPVSRKYLDDLILPLLRAGTPADGHHAAQRIQVGGEVLSKVEQGRRLRAFAEEHGLQDEITDYKGSYKYGDLLREKFSLATGIPLSALTIGRTPGRK